MAGRQKNYKANSNKVNLAMSKVYRMSYLIKKVSQNLKTINNTQYANN